MMETSTTFALQAASYYDQRTPCLSHNNSISSSSRSPDEMDSLFGSDDFQLDACLQDSLLSPSMLSDSFSSSLCSSFPPPPPAFAAHTDFCFSAPPACTGLESASSSGNTNTFACQHALSSNTHTYALSAYATHAQPSPLTGFFGTSSLTTTAQPPTSTTQSSYSLRSSVADHSVPSMPFTHHHQHQHNHQHHHTLGLPFEYHQHSRSAGVSTSTGTSCQQQQQQQQQQQHTAHTTMSHTASHVCSQDARSHSHHHHHQQQQQQHHHSHAHAHHHAELFPWPEYVDFAPEPLASLPAFEIPTTPPPPPFERSSFLFEYEPVGACIGSGLSGGVHKCVRRRDNIVFAFKMLPRDEDALRELGIWAACMPHPNVVDIVAIFDNVVPEGHALLAGRPAGRYLIVVMPKMHSDLFDYLQLREDNALPFTEPEVRAIAQQLSSVLTHIHARGFVHGDIKLENVLLESPLSLNIRLCDFGFARLAAHTPTKRQFTRYYVSPEAIQSYDHKDRHNMFLHFGASSDIWALGVAIYILLFSVPPFDSLPHEPGCQDSKVITPHMRRTICKGTFSVTADRWLVLSGAARNFFTSILTPSVEMRPTAQSLLSYPWFNSTTATTATLSALSGHRRASLFKST